MSLTINDHGANTSVRASSGLGRRLRGEYLRQGVFGVGQGAGLGEVDGGLDGSGDFPVGLLKLLPGRYALLHEAVDESCYRIVGLAQFDLAGRSRVRWVATSLGVGAPAVGLAFQQGGAAPSLARRTASCAASCTARTSVPSTVTPGIP